MDTPPRPTLDQIEVFLRVVDEQSFSGAARRLRRAQSAVSYAIKSLETQLDVELFDRSGHLPKLTKAGEALLADAREVEVGVARLTERARDIAGGTEAEVSLAVDVFLPTGPMIDALRAFRAEFPLVSLRLYSEALGAVAQLVLDGSCQLGVSGPLHGTGRRLEVQALTSVPMVAVAAPKHPLAQLRGSIPTAVLAEQVQIVLSDRSRITEGVDIGVLSSHTWRVSDLRTKRELLRAGFGFGSMPRHLVEDDLKRRRLVRLRPAEWVAAGFEVPLYAISLTSNALGPAGRWLLDRLRAECGPG